MKRIEDIDFSKYNVEIVQDQVEHEPIDDWMQYALKILNDRSIPEANKVDIRKQFDEVINIKSMMMSKPPKIILTPKTEAPAD